MKHTYEYPIDPPTAFLTTLDVMGSLTISNFEWRSSGIHRDMDRLTNDLMVLENDYLKAVEKLSQSEGIHNGRFEN